MPNYNRITLIGHVTRDIEMKQVRELKIGKIGLATNRNFKKDGEWQSTPMYIDVDCFAAAAERAEEFARKGACILVEGELVMDVWEDKTTGAKRSKHYVRADRVLNMGKKADAESRSPAARVEALAGEWDGPEANF